jgi:hypothetical protein
VLISYLTHGPQVTQRTGSVYTYMYIPAKPAGRTYLAKVLEGSGTRRVAVSQAQLTYIIL